MSIPFLAGQTHLSGPTVAKALAAMAKAGIVREITGKKRNRLFSYDRYLKILQEGTEQP